MCVRLNLALCGVGLAVLWTTACSSREDVFARIGEHEVDVSTYQAYLQGVTGEAWEAVDERAAARLLEQFLDQEVVAQAAQRRGDRQLPVHPDQRSAVVRSMLSEVCGQPPDPDPEVFEEKVGQRMAQVRPNRAKVRQLLLGTAEQAQSVRQRLDQGEDFLTLSQQVSRVPNAASGGDLGFLSQGSLTAELDEVIFALEAGEISQPVQGPSGFHIFQVLEIVPAGPPARPEVEGIVIRELRQEGARVFIRECIDDLVDEVGVTLDVDRLWFRYDGRYSKGGKVAH